MQSNWVLSVMISAMHFWNYGDLSTALLKNLWKDLQMWRHACIWPLCNLSIGQRKKLETITLLSLLFKHLEGKKTHARLLYIDFPSAFNTNQPHIVATRLTEHSESSHNLLGWIIDFSTNRAQRMKVNGSLSYSLCSFSGLPPAVFSLPYFIFCTQTCA